MTGAEPIALSEILYFNDRIRHQWKCQLIYAETSSPFVFLHSLGVLKFDGVIFPEHKINQHPHDLAIVLQERVRLIDAEGC